MRTKSLYYLLVCVCAFAFTTNAQETKFGLKAGVNLANISSDVPDYESDMMIGFYGGGSVLLGLSDNFGINADVLYSIKGAKQKTEETMTLGSITTKYEFENTVTLSYIEIPILARYTLESGLYFNAGPYIGLRAGFKVESDATVSITTNGVTTTTSESESSTDDEGWSSSDFGIKVGLGYALESGLDFSANYGLGLSNLIDVDDYDYYYKNGVISIGIGYWFGSN
jgi:hypothetical protein